MIPKVTKKIKKGIKKVSNKTPNYVQKYLKKIYSLYLINKSKESASSRKKLRKGVSERIGDRYTERALRPKVFGIGLSRTGTTSLSSALQYLGYESLHWQRNGQVLGWPEFFFADAATDVPCSAQFESLYHTFGESKFIYTVRDIDRWKESMIRHTGGMKCPREWRGKGERFGGSFRSNVRHVQVWESLYCQYDSWQDAYVSFESRVRNFFEDKPEDRFLEMNITEGDGWEPLCTFLDHEVPGRPFPHIKHWDDTERTEA